MGPEARHHTNRDSNSGLSDETSISIRMKFYVIDGCPLFTIGKGFNAQLVAGAQPYAVNCPPR